MRTVPLLGLLLALAFAASAPAAGTYAGWIPNKGGSLYNDDPVVVTTDDAGTVVRSVVMAFRPKCTDGREFAFHRRLPVRMTDGPGGELVPLVNAGGRFEGRLQAESVSGEYEFVESGTVKGTFTRGAASGTIAVSVAVFDAATGAAVMTCQTNTMRFKLQRDPGRVYGGTTAQGEPVAMFLTKNRRMVWEFGVDMNAPCQPSGFMDLADWVVEFKIRGGRFGDRFSFRRNGDTYRYVLRGKVTPRRASGTLSLTLVAAEGGVCRTGTMRWSLVSG